MGNGKRKTVTEPEPYESLPDVAAGFQGRGAREGAEFDELAPAYLESAGATITQRGGKLAGMSIDALVRGANGKVFCVLAHGNIDDGRRPGLRRTDTVRKAGSGVERQQQQVLVDQEGGGGGVADDGAAGEYEQRNDQEGQSHAAPRRASRVPTPAWARTWSPTCGVESPPT